MNAGINKRLYLGKDFVLIFPSVAHITKELKHLGTAAHRVGLFQLDPSDLDLLGLEWCDDAYVYTCLPSGVCHRSQNLSEIQYFGMQQHGYDVNYVNDFIGVATPSISHESLDELCILLHDL